MHRRALLSALATLPAATTAGCGFRLSGPIARRSFEICDADGECAEKVPDAGGDPVVERHPDERRIVVYGFMYVGSGSCDRAVLDSAHVANDTLVVRVGVESRGAFGFGVAPTLGCTADMSADRYRATVRFRSSLPADVTVIEDAAYDPESTPGGE
ncbi:hypothetical protein [Halobaculum gomorrense]|uniref:Lipoprotein n=1 Tax=Halobaculum gomorrense TaxID=43928 RepID=A0A1M5T746_9EURY|nr:hypothetical protein [Halobaculum gomorrense]SHH46508.1 hypothetical protein SAMN05443636_2662 [Halobaculum gomorrense]